MFRAAESAPITRSMDTRITFVYVVVCCILYIIIYRDNDEHECSKIYIMLYAYVLPILGILCVM